MATVRGECSEGELGFCSGGMPIYPCPPDMINLL